MSHHNNFPCQGKYYWSDLNMTVLNFSDALFLMHIAPEYIDFPNILTGA